MRLYKKAAACLLAAAMALSMLTACGVSVGGGSIGGGDNPDSKPGTSEGGEENPGGEEKPGTEEGDKEDPKGDNSESSSGDSGTITWETSKAYNFGKKYGGTNLQMEYDFVLLETSNESLKDELNQKKHNFLAISGKQKYLKYTSNNGTGRQILIGNTFYLIDDENKFCVISTRQDDSTSTSEVALPTVIEPGKITAGTEVVDGVMYTTERLHNVEMIGSEVLSKEYIYYFDQTDELAFVIVETNSSKSGRMKYWIKYYSITTNVNTKLFETPELPEDYRIYESTNIG